MSMVVVAWAAQLVLAQAPPGGAGGGASAVLPAPGSADWLQLFNGRDLQGWTPKFTRHPLGENFRDTFRVRDGVLLVRYDAWDRFDGEFGHLFYERPFSYYRVAAEYRFVGTQPAGSPAWANRNNGFMLHAQDPSTMLRDQDFPVSIEAQFLGGLGDGKTRPTASVCTPGTHIEIGGVLITDHCVTSRARTFDGDQWVRVEIEVLGSDRLRHFVNGDLVHEYRHPSMGGGQASPVDPAIKVDGVLLAAGYIAIQAETAPIDIRRIELLPLEGCMDQASKTFRPYFVHANPAACR